MDSSPRLQWWSLETIAVVTGGNRGIGLETVRQLASKGLTVVMTARNETLGRAAMEGLHSKFGLTNVVFHKLDIESLESVAEFAKWLQCSYGGLDILVNNAGTANLDFDDKELAIRDVKVNYIGTKNMTEAMLPLLKPSDAGARIIFINSIVGQLINIKIPEMREQLSNPETLTQSQIDNICQKFLTAIEAGKEEVDKFGFAYSISKVLLNAYSRLLNKRVSERPEGHKVYVNNVHPGGVMTDMNPIGTVTIEDGADTGVWLSLLPKGVTPSGLFFFERKPLSYEGETLFNPQDFKAQIDHHFAAQEKGHN